MTNEVRVFSFGDKVWRNIQSFPMVPVFHTHSLHESSIKHGVHVNVHVNGTLNWLGIQSEFHNEHQIDWKHISNDKFVIISLDLSTEAYCQLLPPRGFDKVSCDQPTLVVLLDSLCLSHDFNGTDFIIWQMKEFGVQESWIRLLKISYWSLPKLPYDHRLSLFPLCLYENNDTLILAWRGKKDKIIPILYNLRNSRVKKSRFTNEIEWVLTKDYVESLVSTS